MLGAAAALSVPALCPARAAGRRRPPRPISDLSGLPQATAAGRRLHDVDGGPGYKAWLLGYRHDGMQQHALVCEPLGQPPPGGWPLLLANHGFHPDPPRYGITREGRDWRPGDYYRPVPTAYTAASFLVVMPDYRGHNSSEGLAYTRGFLASAWYSEDVMALLGALQGLPHADANQLFMWGHSMGGEVTLRALLATDRVRAASLWSTVGGDLWEQAYHYSRYQDWKAFDSSATPKEPMDRLRRDLAEMGPGFELATTEPLHHLQRLRTPLVLQHAIDDGGADYRWSARLAQELYRLGKPYGLHSLPGADHFFQGAALQAAVARDVAFFRSRMTT